MLVDRVEELELEEGFFEGVEGGEKMGGKDLRWECGREWKKGFGREKSEG